MVKLDFNKNKDGLIPVIIQDYYTLQILMLGYMNEEAYQKTLAEKRVTFYSRSRQKLWLKGETSGNFLIVKEMISDCDDDSLLIKAEAMGPTCHLGNTSCFDKKEDKGFLYKLEKIIRQRIDDKVAESYTNKLFNKGINKVAQKVGEEAVELIIEAKDDNTDLFKNEAADLLYHFLILLRAKNLELADIEAVLETRMK